jgi:tetratricopeptide (TPR) repeat protein
MDLIDKFTTELTTERGVPTPLFIAHTRLFDKASTILSTFYLDLSPLNIVLMQQLATPPGTKHPAGGKLAIEFSCNDPDPEHAFDVLVVPPTLQKELAAANRESRQLTIILQEEKRALFGQPSTRSALIPGTYQPYVLDWNGMVGIVGRVRSALQQKGTPPDDSFTAALEGQIAEFGVSTNLYTELGVLYRLREDFDRAIYYHREEIRFGLLPDGQPSKGSQRAFNNLGVVYKKRQEYDRARDSFIVALALNPNYFEALVSVAGVLGQAEAALVCVSRAYRIRPGDPALQQLITEMAPDYGQTPVGMLRQVERLAGQIDLTKPAPIASAEPISTLVQRLLN